MFYQASRPLNPATDIVFLMDASSGMSRDDFRWQKEFIKLLAKHFNVNAKGPRAIVVSYSNTARSITTSMDSDFNTKIDSTEFAGLPRRMDSAINYAASLLSQTRRKGVKIVLLLTGGPQARGATPLAKAIKPLRDLGALVYLMAIGSNDAAELGAVPTRREDFFRVQEASDLPRLARPIAGHIYTSYSEKKPIHIFVIILNNE